MKLCVVGLGEVGLPSASYMVNEGFETWGYDANVSCVNKAKQCGILAAVNWNRIPHGDINAYIICVSN